MVRSEVIRQHCFDKGRQEKGCIQVTQDFYMSSERIRTLIAELQELRLRESAVIDEIVNTDQAREEEEKEEEDERAVTADGTNIQVGSRVRIKKDRKSVV